METETKIKVQCEGRLVVGSKMKYSNSFGNYLPPEAPEIEDFRVWLVGRDSRINITNHISESERIELYEEYLAQCLAGDT